MSNYRGVSKENIKHCTDIEMQIANLAKDILSWQRNYCTDFSKEFFLKILSNIPGVRSVILNLARNDNIITADNNFYLAAYLNDSETEKNIQTGAKANNISYVLFEELLKIAKKGYTYKAKVFSSPENNLINTYIDAKAFLDNISTSDKYENNLSTISQMAKGFFLLNINLVGNQRNHGQIWLIMNEEPSNEQLDLLTIYSGIIAIKYSDYIEDLNKQQFYEQTIKEEQKKLDSALKTIEYLNKYDQLTGLFNRKHFEKMIKTYDNPEFLPLTIVMADANGFKQINDAFGHAFGDEMLCSAADVIKSQCRKNDIAARLGGDEFVILMPYTDQTAAQKRVKAMRQLCSSIELKSVGLSISFGWETKTSPDTSFNLVYTQAENRMYRRKLFESPSVRGKRIHTIVQTLNETHPREEKHSRRVGWLCEKLGQSIGCEDSLLKEFKTIGMMHDIGKIAISDSVLDKCGPLSEYEYKEIKRHPEIGFRILSTVHDLADMADSVLSHHERWDGKGYPRQLQGDQIPLGARIVSIADCYDAITSDRPYRCAESTFFACHEIIKNAGIQFDPKLARVFVDQVGGWQS